MIQLLTLPLLATLGSCLPLVTPAYPAGTEARVATASALLPRLEAAGAVTLEVAEGTAQPELRGSTERSAGRLPAANGRPAPVLPIRQRPGRSAGELPNPNRDRLPLYFRSLPPPR